VATVENIKRNTGVVPVMPIFGQFPCATPATDLAWSEATAIQGKRVRMTATTTGMGHVGTAGYVPGSLTWSPPI
jgi:hypothetical protein